MVQRPSPGPRDSLKAVSYTRLTIGRASACRERPDILTADPDLASADPSRRRAVDSVVAVAVVAVVAAGETVHLAWVGQSR